MEILFLKLLNMSITAGWLVLVVILLRPLLRKAPKAIRCILWGMVGLRLVCPFSFESVLSLIPSAETVPEEILYASEPAVHTGIESLNMVINPMISESFAPKPILTSINPLQVIAYLAALIWIVGMIAMVLYALVSYLRLRRRVRVSLPLQDRICLCDEIGTPFILGIFRPRIYLPSAMDGEQREYVIAHEQAHLRRRDHWWKPLGYALLTVYWFHPLMWLAYILLCRDIELACDEKVIKEMDSGDKKGYSEALLACSMPRRSIAACPLAFGELGVKGRIKTVLNYKKPAFWILLAAFLVCIAVPVFFLTDPLSKTSLPDYESGSDLEGLSLVLKEAELSGSAPYLKVDWRNRSEREVDFGEMYTLQYKDGGEWVDCDLAETRVFNMIGYLLKPRGSFEMRYSLSHYDLSKPGTYRLSANCSVTEGSKVDQYTVWLEFWLEFGIKAVCFEPNETVYENGSFSYVVDAKHAPYYRFFNGILSSHEREGQGWKVEGTMYPTQLKKENFDNLLQGDTNWYYYLSAGSLRRNNAQTWRLWDGNTLYYLLEQKEGEVYLAVGEETQIRWVYRLRSINEGMLVDQSDPNSEILDELTTLEQEVNDVILAHHQPESPDGYIHAASHAYIGIITASSTPQAAYSGYLNEITLCIMAQHEIYTAGESPQSVGKTTLPAVLRFRMDEAGNYTLLEYTETADVEVINSKFPQKIDEELLDPWYYQKVLDEKSHQMAIEIQSDMRNAVF